MDSRYIMEEETWDALSKQDKDSEIQFDHFLDVFIAIVHETCRIGVEVEEEKLLEFPSANSMSQEYGADCYEFTGTFGVLKTEEKKSFIFTYLSLLQDLLRP